MNFYAFQVLLVTLAFAAIVLLASCGSSDGDIDIPEAPQRSGLLFGYYGTADDQVAETIGHVNLLFENFWDGQEAAILNMRIANLPTVIDLGGPTLSDYGTLPRTIRPDAEQRVRATFDALQTAGVLHLVRYIVPSDEPNLPENGSVHLLPEIVPMIRRVALDYPQLEGVRMGVIYYSDKPMDHLDLFDVVGFDRYEEKSGIFAPGAMYERMKKRLRPDQQTWIIPGATYGQNPTPFVNFANGNPEVLAIVPFLWRDPHDNPGFDGIHNMPEMRLKYEAAGRQITGRL